jgi:sulfur-oxidizing protein SoxX
MRKNSRFMLAAGLIGLVLTTSSFAAENAKPAEPSGKDLAFNNKKGNCLACHLMPGVPGAISSTTIGPPLVGMKTRFPDKAKLRAQVWDATKANPQTSMPPFGKHQILSEQEIDKIVDFIYGI